MKRVLALTLALCGLLTACGATKKDKEDKSAPLPDGSAAETAAYVVMGQKDLPAMTCLTPEDESFLPYLEGSYGLDAALLEDAAICFAGGVHAGEVAVFYLKDEEDEERVRKALGDYRKQRAGAFAGYAPEAYSMVEDSVIRSRGRCVALFICPDTEAATQDFRSCFHSSWQPPEITSVFAAPMKPPKPAELDPPEPVEPDPPEPVEPDPPAGPVGPVGPVEPDPPPVDLPVDPPQPAEDVYDHDAVVAAWQTGFTEGLGEKNRAVLEMCRKIFDEHLRDDMTPVEKERAVHDYMVLHAQYDPAELSNNPNDVPDPDNDNPYGLLVHGLGICRGYASSFQLMMDLLGIECITVEGTNLEGEAHAWNQVRIDGQWYCVDVTWDDPVGGRGITVTFFNRNSDWFRYTGHVWDWENTPEAI